MTKIIKNIIVSFLMLGFIFILASCAGNKSPNQTVDPNGNSGEIGPNNPDEPVNPGKDDMTYTLTTNVNNSLAGSVSSFNNKKINKDESVTVEATTNPGYTFVGWYDGENEVSTNPSYDYEVGSSDITIEAKYTINKYTITIDNQALGVTISGIISGNEYEYDSKISLVAANIPDGYTIKWERSDIGTYIDDNYEFNVPLTNIIITISITRPYTRVDNKIYFGKYPQKLA